MEPLKPADSARGLRRRAFWSSYWIGVAATLGLVALLATFWPRGFQPDGRFLLVGADISRSGGTKVVLRQPSDTWTLTCRDDCDDVRLLTRAPTADGYAPQITDAKGGCVLCSGSYVDTHQRSNREISGSPKLTEKYTLRSYPRRGEQTWPVGPPGSF